LCEKVTFVITALKILTMDRRENTCCIVGCTNADEERSSDAKFYRFPSNDQPVSSIQRSMWIDAIQSGRYLSVKVKVTWSVEFDLGDRNSYR